MSDSVRLHRWQPTRLLCPWDSPGKNTGVGCHFLLQCRKVKSKSEVAQSCPTLRDPMDCSPPGSSVHGIFQARVLEWGAIATTTKRTGLLNRTFSPPDLGLGAGSRWEDRELQSPQDALQSRRRKQGALTNTRKNSILFLYTDKNAGNKLNPHRFGEG